MTTQTGTVAGRLNSCSAPEDHFRFRLSPRKVPRNRKPRKKKTSLHKSFLGRVTAPRFRESHRSVITTTATPHLLPSRKYYREEKTEATFIASSLIVFLQVPLVRLRMMRSQNALPKRSTQQSIGVQHEVPVLFSVCRAGSNGLRTTASSKATAAINSGVRCAIATQSIIVGDTFSQSCHATGARIRARPQLPSLPSVARCQAGRPS